MNRLIPGVQHTCRRDIEISDLVQKFLMSIKGLSLLRTNNFPMPVFEPLEINHQLHDHGADNADGNAGHEGKARITP